jgi:hypothetical protein
MVALVLIASLSQVQLIPAPNQNAPLELPDVGRTTADAKAREASAVVTKRVLLSGGAGVLGAGVGLGIALLFTLPNPSFDARFATAALCSLLVTGGAFLVHQGFGGQGEVMLALLGSIAAMAAATFAATAIDSTVPMTPILTAVLGALPGAALAVLALEGTSARQRPAVRVAVAPTGLTVVF